MSLVRIKKKSSFTLASIEKRLIEKHFDFVKCELQGSKLICKGAFEPTKESEIYFYKIEYIPPKSPVVHVLSPQIEYNDEIHMYPSDNSLCLYHKSDLIWDDSKHIYDTIIPWTHEWFIFYELYQLTGKWWHPEVKHTPNTKRK